MEPVAGETSEPVDRLLIQLRTYLDVGPDKTPPKRPRWPSDYAVVFDTETVIDPSQRLQFGAYQVRLKGALIERGVFYADDLSTDDLKTLHDTFAAERPTEAGEKLSFLTRAGFVENILFRNALDVGGYIVGFNLPFDLSRIALSHTYGRGRMNGGFSFEIGEARRPNVRVKHLNRRAAFINFPRARKGAPNNPGFFVDVKTLAASLTNSSVSLGSLAKLLGTTPKSDIEEHGGPLTPERIRYGMTDVQVTWECFEKLAEQYAAYGLKTGMQDLYSEASVGKAFLEEMNITPWRKTQPDFPPALIGQIMSAYFGGRAEVHIRRQITPVLHCDFLSMYPTVCTLMGLWRYVIADGLSYEDDATDEVRSFVSSCTKGDLQNPDVWRRLACIVQVRPDDDVFPVRARYESDLSATIGLNRLRSKEPLWFTLADVLASKLLTGNSPEILQAIRFAPGAPQKDIRPIHFAGAEIHPAKDDFYKLLIDRRREVRAKAKAAKGLEKNALNSAQQSLKILANSTSYGIFIELNVEGNDAKEPVCLWGHDGVGVPIKPTKVEKPGKYFHPLVGTLITGAARLMLALAEHNALDQGLDWAFCDTDSLAIANPHELPDLVDRVQAVRKWFEPLNPYATKGSILQLEKVNFPPDHDGDETALRPTNCLAISAKRYVIFDRAADGTPTVRKAMRHGLGHLIAPYDDPDRSARMDDIGAELWQEDLWKAIIAADDAGHPTQVDYAALRNFDGPAASRYAATNPTLLDWFKGYNSKMPQSERVQPFNFLLSYSAKSAMEMAGDDPYASDDPVWSRRNPAPASRFSSDLIKDRPDVFDRKNGMPIKWDWLQTRAKALVRYHLHSEIKFRGGELAESGVLHRRMVEVAMIIPIGKESDNLDAREVLGEDGDVVEWDISNSQQAKVARNVEALISEFGVKAAEIVRTAGVSHHTLSDVRSGRLVRPNSLYSLVIAVEQLRQVHTAERQNSFDWRVTALFLAEALGSQDALASALGISGPYLSRLISGRRSISLQLLAKLSQMEL